MIIKKRGLKKKLRLHKMMVNIGSPMTTIEIYEMFNERYRKGGYTMTEIANILSKTPIFKKVDRITDVSRNRAIIGKGSKRQYMVYEPVELPKEGFN